METKKFTKKTIEIIDNLLEQIGFEQIVDMLQKQSIYHTVDDIFWILHDSYIDDAEELYAEEIEYIKYRIKLTCKK